MRTVVVDGPHSIRVDTRPDPVLPGADGAIVEVSAAGICGSDLHFYEGDFPLAEPMPLGHEAVGTVVEIGPDVRTVAVGDQVLVSSVTGCGASGASAWMTSLDPEPLEPVLESDEPPRMPPEPLVERDTLSGVKYCAMPFFWSSVVTLRSHNSRKNAIIAVTKSA